MLRLLDPTGGNDPLDGCDITRLAAPAAPAAARSR